MTYKKPRLIAEAGCNHKGDLATARDMIKTAAIYCKADIIKFQNLLWNSMLNSKNGAMNLALSIVHLYGT